MSGMNRGCPMTREMKHRDQPIRIWSDELPKAVHGRAAPYSVRKPYAPSVVGGTMTRNAPEAHR